ncbi:MAG: hypothetical protein MJ171_06685 [Clostridia bacterium]|nr:hypothetical protein [Clostridia bacterium]
MYCVKCGVKLQDGIESCPLCGTPVWNPDGVAIEGKYPDKMPKKPVETNMPLAILFTFLSVITVTVLFVVCMNLYGNLSWGGYAIFGVMLFYVMMILPLWFRKPNPVIFTPVNFLAIALYVGYINWKVNGHWFFTFALPIILITAVEMVTVITLGRYVRRGRLYIAGGAVIFMGFATVLVELFQTMTFGTQMFTWSLYSFSVFFIFGMFLIVAGIYKPLKVYLNKKFFIHK